jgi:hypothetical protein
VGALQAHAFDSVMTVHSVKVHMAFYIIWRRKFESIAKRMILFLPFAHSHEIWQIEPL